MNGALRPREDDQEAHRKDDGHDGDEVPLAALAQEQNSSRAKLGFFPALLTDSSLILPSACADPVRTADSSCRCRFAAVADPHAAALGRPSVGDHAPERGARSRSHEDQVEDHCEDDAAHDIADGPARQINRQIRDAAEGGNEAAGREGTPIAHRVSGPPRTPLSATRRCPRGPRSRRASTTQTGEALRDRDTTGRAESMGARRPSRRRCSRFAPSQSSGKRPGYSPPRHRRLIVLA